MTNRQLEIIEAAGKILSTAGVSGLRIKNLAKEMGFSESAIYRHFKSKEEIIVALLTFLAGNMDERYGKAISIDQSPAENFQSLFQSQFAFFKSHPYFVVSIFSAGLMEESERINAAIKRIMVTKMKYLLPVIKAGQQQKYFTNEITAEEMIMIVMGTFRLQMYKWKETNFQSDIVKMGDQMIQALLTLIQTK